MLRLAQVCSMPAGLYSATGAGVKTNLLFFTKGKPTKAIWYYDISDLKVGKKTQFTRDKLDQLKAATLSLRCGAEYEWKIC